MNQNDITLDELLQRQDEIYLVWLDPWPGEDADGNVVDVHIISRATVRDCINIIRHVQTPEGKKGADFNDKDLLRGFIAVNHARPATIEENNL